MNDIISYENITTDKLNPHRVTLCADNKYRWTYEYNMYKNPTILFTIYNVILMAFSIVAIFSLILNIIEGNFSWPPFQNFDWDSSKYGIITLGIFLFILPPLSYLIVAKYYGGVYTILFEMDDEQITGYQLYSIIEKNKKLALFSGLIGLTTGNLSLIGISLNNMTRDSMTSEYTKVKKIIPRKRRNLIKVNNKFKHNQIYVYDEDYDFVLNYLQLHTQTIYKEKGNV